MASVLHLPLPYDWFEIITDCCLAKKKKKKTSGKRTKVNVGIHLVKSGKQESPIRWGVNELRWQLINFRHSVSLVPLWSWWIRSRVCFLPRLSLLGRETLTYFFSWKLQDVLTGFPGGSVLKNPPANARDPGLIPRLGRSPEEEMAIPSGILAWEIPWTEEPRQVTARGVARSQTWLSTQTESLTLFSHVSELTNIEAKGILPLIFT